MTLEPWLEHDYNPFFLFDEFGRVRLANAEGQRILSKIPSKVVFDLALEHASRIAGFSTFFGTLSLGDFRFFGLMVGYADDQEIGIRLYREPLAINLTPQGSKKSRANLYTLLDLAIFSLATRTQARFLRLFDPSIPELYFELDAFMRAVCKGYEMLLASQQITTRVFLATGEFLIVEEKRLPVLNIELTGDSFTPQSHLVESIQKNIAARVSLLAHGILLSLPMINEEREKDT